VECNTLHLRPIEDRVNAAILKGYKGVANLDPVTLFLWLGKIFYGLLYKELFLVRDRKSGRSAPIVNKREQLVQQRAARENLLLASFSSIPL